MGLELNRADALRAAHEKVSGDRQESYGDPRTNHERIASLWSTALGHPFTAADVVLAMVLVKVSRLVQDPGNSDSWVDLAGYAGLGCELNDEEAPRGDDT